MDEIFTEFGLVVSFSDVGDLAVGTKVSPVDTHVDEFYDGPEYSVHILSYVNQVVLNIRSTRLMLTHCRSIGLWSSPDALSFLDSPFYVARI